MAEQDNSETVKTWSLWVMPRWNIRADDILVVEGLSRAQGDSIIDMLGDMVEGHLSLQPDEI